MAVCFFSYSRTPLDQTALRAIRTILDGAQISYWFDEFLQNQGGRELNAEIANEIVRSKLVIILASSQYVSSRYCQSEAVFALEKDKPVLRINLEAYDIPPALLSLASTSQLDWRESSLKESCRKLVSKLAEFGVDASLGLKALGAAYDTLDDSRAGFVRPPYSKLRSGAPDYLQDVGRRLNEAATSNPSNGYNHLSLAFLWLLRSDSERALQAARRAVDLLPRIADAHYAEALCLCSLCEAQARSKEYVEDILRRLAIARRLPNAGAHIELLSALVIANYYLPKYLTPPIEPGKLLERGLSGEIAFDPDEISRVLDNESLLDPASLPSLRVYRERLGRM